MPEKIIKFKQWDCRMEIMAYMDGNPALRLIDIHKDWDNLIAVASVNLPGLKITEIAIKDYSENEGMYQTLLDANVITPAHRFAQSGWIDKIPVCFLKSK